MLQWLPNVYSYVLVIFCSIKGMTYIKRGFCTFCQWSNRKRRKVVPRTIPIKVFMWLIADVQENWRSNLSYYVYPSKNNDAQHLILNHINMFLEFGLSRYELDISESLENEYSQVVLVSTRRIKTSSGASYRLVCNQLFTQVHNAVMSHNLLIFYFS